MFQEKNIIPDWNFGTAIMLKENPQKRPNIYEVVKEVCDMQKKEVPIRDVRSSDLQVAGPNILTTPHLDLLQSISL